MGNIKVRMEVEVPRNCSTCLYGRFCGCAHADRQRDWSRYALFGGCPSFWLDQRRFPEADRRW